MQSLNQILDWKLLRGSHEYPGPSGGTCINEAAIVVAGLPYKSVSSPADLPPCFSRVIGAYLVAINDSMSDGARQRLIEFAPRLSGSADTPEVEQQRLEYIVVETVRRIVSMAMEAAALGDHASKCRAVTTFDEARLVAADAANAANAADAADAAYAANGAKAANAAASAYAANAAKAANGAKAAYAADAAIDDHCIEIVRGSLAIGNQAASIETALIVSRAAKIREQATA
jgi:hypothetical protein